VEERAQASGMVRFQQGKPIVLKLKKGKNRKYRYSRGLGDIQKAEGQLTRVTKKAAQSVSKGVSEYDRQRRKSAGKKRDGAVRDFIPNAGIAMSEALGEAADIPTDISKMLNTKSSRRMLRRRLRMASDAVRLFPF
jgi:hypothetical protein